MRVALSGDHGRGVTRDYAAQEIVAAWRYLPALDWSMVVKIDLAEAMAPAQRLRRFVGLMLSVSLLFAGLIGLTFGRSLVRPIFELMAAAARVAGGDLRTRAPLVNLLEFRHLAESFNHMTGRPVAEQALLVRHTSL